MQRPPERQPPPSRELVGDLFGAIRRGDAGKAATLLEQDARMVKSRQQGDTPLHVATATGSAASVHVILKAGGSDLAARSKAGKSPLHLAASAGDASIMQLLLQYSDKDAVDAPGPSGNRALHFAAKAGKVNLIDLLLEAGAAIEAKDNVRGGRAGRRVVVAVVRAACGGGGALPRRCGEAV